MKRISGLFLTVATLLVPAAAHAQKPSDMSETRSADVYMANAEKTVLASEKKDWYNKALDMARQALAKEPNNPKPYLQIGLAQHKLGNFMAADSAFTQAEKMYPEYAKQIAPERDAMWVGVFNEAVKRINAKDVPGGIEMFKLASRINPTRYEALQSLGSIYLQMGDLPNAEQAYREELTVLRSPARKKLDAKKEAAAADAELNAVRALAEMYSQTNKVAEAEAMYRELLVKDPQNPAILSNLAITLTRAKKTDDANVIYSQLLGRTDLTGSQLLNVGIGLHNANQYEKAAEAFDRAAALSPYSYDILDFEVNSLSGVVDKLVSAKADKATLVAAYQKLIDVAQKALALSPMDGSMIMRLAAAQRGMSDNDAAAKTADWRKAVLATLTKNETLPVSLTNIQSAADEKTVTLTGEVTGMSAKAGTPVKVKFSMLDKDGKVVSSKDVEIPAPAKDARTPFSVTIDAPATAVSWKYEAM